MLDRADPDWRPVYLFPVLLNVLMLVGYCGFIKSEPILYSIRVGDTQQALELIDKVYDKSESRLDVLTRL